MVREGAELVLTVVMEEVRIGGSAEEVALVNILEHSNLKGGIIGGKSKVY